MADTDEEPEREAGPPRPVASGASPLPSAATPDPPAAASIWDRVKRHKVVEWTLAYIAFGYAALHGAEMLRDAFEWSPAVPRLTFLALALGLPIAMTLAWYHGHRAQHRVSRTELATLAALLVLAGSALWLAARSERAHVAAGVVTNFIPIAKPLGEKSIAVLPFLDLSEKKDQEYFSDGLSEELIDLLAQTRDLQVIARTSSFYFKGKQVTISDIAKTLGAANILEGSVRKAANTIRVTAQLIRADDDVHLWSESYDRDIGDIFKVQDEIAAAVVGALKLKLLPAEQLKDPDRSDSQEAYNQFLLCRQLNRRGTLEDFRRATAAARKAIELDPGYAAAYAALAITETNVADYNNGATGYASALEAAEKSLSLAPQLVLGYRARAGVRLATFYFAEARADVEQALALAPGDGGAQALYGNVLATLGRLPEAIAAANKAIELDPINSAAWANLGLYLTARRDFPAARHALERSLAISPDDEITHNNLGSLDLIEGRLDDAMVEYHKSDEAIRQMGESMVAYTRGHEAKSQQELQQMIATHASDSAYQVAEVYAWRREEDKAFAWLQRAYQQHDEDLNIVTYDPFLDNLRADPRFAALLMKLKLSE
jgi:TolB-like protein/Tfp pilus assembly protein PilF